MTLHGLEHLSTELREQRLRTRVDEQTFLLAKKTRENRTLRERCEKQQLRITAMRGDQRVQTDRIRWLEHQLARAAADRPFQTEQANDPSIRQGSHAF